MGKEQLAIKEWLVAAGVLAILLAAIIGCIKSEPGVDLDAITNTCKGCPEMPGDALISTYTECDFWGAWAIGPGELADVLASRWEREGWEVSSVPMVGRVIEMTMTKSCEMTKSCKVFRGKVTDTIDGSSVHVWEKQDN